MRNLIETLESRQLFSTVLAVGALHGAVVALPGDYKGVVARDHANFKPIETELKGAGELKLSNSDLKSWAAHATAAAAAVSKDLTKTIALINGDVSKLETAASHLKKNPTSTALQNAQAAVVTKMQNDASSHFSAINAAISNMAAVDTAAANQIIALNASDAHLKSTFAAVIFSNSDGRSILASAVGGLLIDAVPNVITALT
jgi:hypothetical protein